LIFWRRSFGKSFFVLLWSRDSNFVIQSFFFEIIREPSIKDSRPKIMNVVETPDRRAEIMAYLRGHYEPQDELEEKRWKQRHGAIQW
jgi:hypothetical protein